MGWRRWLRLMSCAVIAGASLGLAACGVSAGKTGGTAATPRAGTTQGPVTLAPSQQRYAPSDTIEVTIHNGLTTSTFALDNHTSCTTVTLERLVGASWQAEGACVNMVPHPNLVEFKPGATITQLLAPPSGTDLTASWPVGTYRAAFAYVTSASQPLGQSTVVYSPSFTVG